MASLNVLMSGIHLYNATTMGNRRNNKTKIAITTNLQTDKVNAPSWNLPNGIQAPTNTKAATLNRRSMTDEKTDSSVWRLKKPSQAKAVPQQKAARRSSEPSIVVIPMVSSARATYWAT